MNSKSTSTHWNDSTVSFDPHPSIHRSLNRILAWVEDTVCPMKIFETHRLIRSWVRQSRKIPPLWTGRMQLPSEKWPAWSHERNMHWSMRKTASLLSVGRSCRWARVDFLLVIPGGYNLYVDIPEQKETETDYLIKFNGDVVRIPPITPGRVHFGK